MKRLLYLFALGAAPLVATDITIQPYGEIGFGLESYKWKMDHRDEVTDCFTSAEWKNIHTAGFQVGVKAYPFESLPGDWMAGYWFDIHADWYFNVDKAPFNGKFREFELFGPPLEIETRLKTYRVGDFAVDIGYDFCLTPCLTLAHVLGFSAKKQHFSNHSGELPVPENLQDELTFLSLRDFHYEASWQDVWTGFQLDWQPIDCITISASANYHLGRFFGHGHWHVSQTLTDGFDFQNHDKVHQNGIYQGLSGKVQIDYAVPCSCWVVTLDCTYRYFLKAQGSDRTKTRETVTMADGTQLSQQFRTLDNPYRIEWRAVVIAAGVKYDF